MTVVEWWEDVFGGERRVAVNGFAVVRVSYHEVRSAADFAGLLLERVTPLIWLAMPGHDLPLEALAATMVDVLAEDDDA